MQIASVGDVEHLMVERHRQLQQERATLVTERKALAVNHRLARRIDAFAERVRHEMDALDFEQRQRLARLLIEQVRVTGPNVQIHLRIPLDETSAACYTTLAAELIGPSEELG